MKKYRRNPKATKKDYSKFQSMVSKCKSYVIDTVPAYYGLIKRGGRVRIDLRRMKKVKTSGVPERVLAAASQIPRNTSYFVPAKIRRDEYVTNRFRDTLHGLREKWHEMKEAFASLKTPEEVGTESYVNAMQTGICDYEEACEKGYLANVRRIRPYHELKTAFHANFIHQIASEVMACILKEAASIGYCKSSFDRSKMKEFFNGRPNKKCKINKLDHCKDFDSFILIWNFLKHNTEGLFRSVKKVCPEMLIQENYKNGELAQNFLRIDDGYIEDSLNRLELFLDELSEAFFMEDPAEASWNYDGYFIQVVNRTIQEIVNPLHV